VFAFLWLNTDQWTAIGAIAGLVIALFAILDAKSAKTAGETAKTQADAAKKIAETAETTAAAAKSQAAAAHNQVTETKRVADAAEKQAGEAKRTAEAAESSASSARQQLEVQLANLAVDFTPVLMRGASGTDYPYLEILWKGPRVTLEKLVATKWTSVLFGGEPDLTQTSAKEEELTLVDGAPLPREIGQGEKLLFRWPGAQPGPRGFGAEVRAEFKLGTDAGHGLTRDVEAHGYGGFRQS
jgi:hypothetical protein